VTDAASQLSFSTLAQNWINDLCQFLEDAEVNLGDAVPASKFQERYSLTLKCLREADPKRYLFDPTLFLARLLIHLRSALYTINHFDINGATKSGGPFLCPYVSYDAGRKSCSPSYMETWPFFVDLFLTDAGC
jgi:hypothetical protein